MECLLHDCSSVLCLAAIPCEALLCCAAATLSGFRVFFDGSYHGGHGALLASMGVGGSGSPSKYTCQMLPGICEYGVTAASRAPRSSCFLLSTICGIPTPTRLFPFPHHLLHAALV